MENTTQERNLHYIGLSGETVSRELYDSLKADLDRTKYNLDVARHTIRKLSEALSNITEPETGKKISDPSSPKPQREQRAESSQQVSSSPKSPSPAKPQQKKEKPKFPSLEDADFDEL